MLRACILLLSLLSVLFLGLAHSRSFCTLVGSEPLRALIGNLRLGTLTVSDCKGGAGSRSFHFQVPRRGCFVVGGSHLEDQWILVLKEKWERVWLLLFTLWFCLLVFEKGSLHGVVNLMEYRTSWEGLSRLKLVSENVLRDYLDSIFHYLMWKDPS